MNETGNVNEKGNVSATKVFGRSKLTHTPPKTTVVFFESVEDFPEEMINEGHRPSICNKTACRTVALDLISTLNLSFNADIVILAERLLRGIAEQPGDPYYLVRDWLFYNCDKATRVAYDALKIGLRQIKFPSDNPALTEQFELPRIEELLAA